MERQENTQERIVVVKKEDMNVNEFRNKYIKLSNKKEVESKLRKHAIKFLNEHFNMRLNIPIEINSRLTSTGGNFYSQVTYGNNGKETARPLKITMSERFMAMALHDGQDGIKAILDILEHELVHYVLCRQGKPYNDGDYEFEKTLAKLNIGASGRTNKNKVMSTRENVWYKAVDVHRYVDNGKVSFAQYRHRLKENSSRVEFHIIKSTF